MKSADSNMRHGAVLSALRGAQTPRRAGAVCGEAVAGARAYRRLVPCCRRAFRWCRPGGRPSCCRLDWEKPSPYGSYINVEVVMSDNRTEPVQKAFYSMCLGHSSRLL